MSHVVRVHYYYKVVYVSYFSMPLFNSELDYSLLRLLQIMHWSFAYMYRHFYWKFMYTLLDNIYQDLK